MSRASVWACLSLVALLVLAGPAAAQDRPAGDRSTPRRALKHFVVACRAGHYDEAATDLDFGGRPVPADAGRLARRFKFVLDQTIWISWEKVPDVHAVNAALDPNEPDRFSLGTVMVDDTPIAIDLTRARGAKSWLIAAGTVSRIPELDAAHGPGWINDVLPESFFRVRFLELEGWQWLGLGLALLVTYVGGRLSARIALGLLGVFARWTKVRWDERLIDALRGPSGFILALLAFEPLVTRLRLSVPAHDAIHGTRAVLLGMAACWACARLVRFLATTVEEVLTENIKDEAQNRGIRTQILILRRVAFVIVMIVCAALVLRRFEIVRNVGTSMLASAGVAGIVIGLAAQKSISTLLAGIQLSVTQPIRIGDTVIVEGEWGWIEEINLTYVVVKVWDLRRLVVPINRFLDHPFQNWTKVSPDIMGTVEIFADYATPVDKVRRELERVCHASPLWDRKVCGLQVTAVSPQTVTLRALVSSADAGKNWDLRCEVRERLVRFLQELEGGRYLPRARVDRATHVDAADPHHHDAEIADGDADHAAAAVTAVALADPRALG